MKTFFKQFNTSHLFLMAIIVLSLFAQYDMANTNEKLRDELEVTKVQLQWAQNDLGACRGDFARAATDLAVALDKLMTANEKAAQRR